MKRKRPKVYDLERFRDLRPRSRWHSVFGNPVPPTYAEKQLLGQKLSKAPRTDTAVSKEGEMIEFIRGLIQSPGVRQALAALAFAIAAYVVGALGVTPPMP